MKNLCKITGWAGVGTGSEDAEEKILFLTLLIFSTKKVRTYSWCSLGKIGTTGQTQHPNTHLCSLKPGFNTAQKFWYQTLFGLHWLTCDVWVGFACLQVSKLCRGKQNGEHTSRNAILNLSSAAWQQFLFLKMHLLSWAVTGTLNRNSWPAIRWVYRRPRTISCPLIQFKSFEYCSLGDPHEISLCECTYKKYYSHT